MGEKDGGSQDVGSGGPACHLLYFLGGCRAFPRWVGVSEGLSGRVDVLCGLEDEQYNGDDNAVGNVYRSRREIKTLFSINLTCH
jgi:hypothetical protein